MSSPLFPSVQGTGGYDGSTLNLQSSGNVGVPPSAAGLPGGLDLDFFMKMLKNRAILAEQDAATNRQRQNLLGDLAMSDFMNQRNRPQQQSTPMLSSQPQPQQQQPQSKGKPVFVKTVGGPGMVGGTIRLNQWEPGAAFAGYEEDLGSGPASAGIQAPGPSRASITGPTNVDADTAARNRDVSYEGPMSDRNMQMLTGGRMARDEQAQFQQGQADQAAQRQMGMDRQRAMLGLIGGGLPGMYGSGR